MKSEPDYTHYSTTAEEALEHMQTYGGQEDEIKIGIHPIDIIGGDIGFVDDLGVPIEDDAIPEQTQISQPKPHNGSGIPSISTCLR
jgi:hypothetical protein